MEYTLNNFTGRYHSIPSVLLDFLPSSEYMVLALIYSSSRKCMSNDKIICSQNVLEKRAGMGRRKVKACIDNLKCLNLLDILINTDKSMSFIINWKEVYALDNFAARVSYTGMSEMKELCFQKNNITPFSDVPEEQKQKIAEAHPFVRGAVKCAKDVDLTAPAEITAPSAVKIAQLAQMTALGVEQNWDVPTLLHKYAAEFGDNSLGAVILTKLAQMTAPLLQNKGLGAVILTKSAEMTAPTTETGAVKRANCAQMTAPLCNEASHFFTKTGGSYTLNVVLSNAERLLVDLIDPNSIEVNLGGAVISTRCGHFDKGGAVILTKNDQGAVISTRRCGHFDQNAPKTCSNDRTVIYNINIKENDPSEYSERSELYEDGYIGGKTKKVSEKIEKQENLEEAKKAEEDKTVAEVVEPTKLPEDVIKTESAEKVKEDITEETFEKAEEVKEANITFRAEAEEEFESITTPSALEEIELVDPYTPQQHYEMDKKKYTLPVNVYRNKPYYPEEILKGLLHNIDLCVTSPVKLFYNNFWYDLELWDYEQREYDAPADESGNVVCEDTSDKFAIVGKTISDTEYVKILCQAWDETLDQIKAGFIELENGRVEVNIKGDLPDTTQIPNLINWRKTKYEGHNYFKISLKGFRNVEAEDVVEVNSPVGRKQLIAANRLNRRFITTIDSMDASQLTPMEAAIKEFADKFIIMDEYYHISGFRNDKGDEMVCDVLPGYIIKPWTLRLSTFNVDREDFYDIINQNGGYKDGADLGKLPGMFSYPKVQRWNELHGFYSKINDKTLLEARC